MQRKTRWDGMEENDGFLGDPKGFAKRSGRRNKKHIIILVVLGCITALGLWGITHRVENRDPRYSLSKQTQYYSHIDADLDKAFVHILRYDDIIEIERYDAGLAEKYICVLESGYQALIKPMEEWHYFPRTVPTWDASRLPPFDNYRLGRAVNEYQGWGEVMGFYLDRALGWNRKPPVSGRYMSNKVLYSADPIFSGGWKKWLPEHMIPVSITIWMQGVRGASPSLTIQQYLTHKSLPRVTSKIREDALGVSNKIIFDFLLDDHDSQASHNYKADSTGVLLHWDSGLAWRHGPNARKNCTILLCGAEPWTEISKLRGEPCEKICLFDINTYEQFAALQSKNGSIGMRMKALMQDEPTYPVVNNGYYHIDTHHRQWAYINKVSFTLDNYLQGIDRRISVVLKHIQQCIQDHGQRQVLH